jgi:ABC-2 type transport system permease protein
MIRDNTAVLLRSMANAWADFRAVYTWYTWVFGWLGRMLAQVLFFTYLGRLVGSQEQVEFLVVGNAVMTCVIEAMMVVASTSWEKGLGTIPLLLAAPGSPFCVFVGRSIQWPVSGAGTSMVALLVLAPQFGVTWRPEQVAPLLGLVLLTAFTTYAFGLCLAVLVLLRSNLRNVVSNVSYLIMMAICGIQVPLSFWPAWVQGVARVLPVTHGVSAVRNLHSGTPQAVILDAATAVVLAVFWLFLAGMSLRYILWRSRRGGLLFA